LIEASGLTWSSGTKNILEDINISISPGTRWGLVGPNGAGKSTLLMLFALLLRPTAGELHVLGACIGRHIPVVIRRQIAISFQQPRFLTGTVWQNVAIPLQLRRLSRQEIRLRVGTWLDRFDLMDLAHQPVHTLSGGEQARLQLARALALKPALLLLDEPFAAVDATSRSILKERLKSALADASPTLVMISHDYSDMLDLTEQTAVMLGGRIVEHGPTETLFRHSKLVQTLFPTLVHRI